VIINHLVFSRHFFWQIEVSQDPTDRPKIYRDCPAEVKNGSIEVTHRHQRQEDSKQEDQ
jgi:hypothetical protein